MVSHLGVVDDPAGEAAQSVRTHGLELFHDLGNARFQVFAQILTDQQA